MIGTQTSLVFRHLDGAELRLCQIVNRICRRPWMMRGFAVISRLGNGVFWYVLILSLAATQGRLGLVAAGHMSLVGVVNVLLYVFLKPRLLRERPFVSHAGIQRGAAPLDRYSFPSGHTLHAVALSLIAVSYFPPLGWLLVPFAMLTALSRVVLGLHYPSDVLAGAAMGCVLAELSFYI